MEIIEGGVTAAQGFEAAGVEAAIKYKNRKDMAMVYSTVPCVCAGTFTTNVVKAAPVVWDKNVVENSAYGQAVVVNSGIANACTGEAGMVACKKTAQAVSDLLGIPADSVFVCSTGVIGRQIEIEKIVAGVKLLVEAKKPGLEAGSLAAEAIMTTDTHSKQAACKVMIGGKEVTVGGMTKGSGMIHPNMCTMLGFITTDACISKEMLTKALRADVKETFNMISVDGDTSTNDTLLCMANGLAGNAEITAEGADYDAFVEALHYVNATLARMMAADGEGASALLEVKVIHAESHDKAKVMAKSVICSSLTKAAIYGHDSNWGRIMCALGYSGAQFDPTKVDLYYESAAGKILICKDGLDSFYSEEEATKILSEKEVTVICDLKEGSESATAWGCDLTYDYVKINADYRS